jgi:hypothetical protein
LGSFPDLPEVSLFALLGRGLHPFFLRKDLFKTPERFVDGLRGKTLSIHEGKHRATNVRRGETALGAFKNILCSLKKSGDLSTVIARDALIGTRERCIHALIVPVASRKRR